MKFAKQLALGLMLVAGLWGEGPSAAHAQGEGPVAEPEAENPVRRFALVIGVNSTRVQDLGDLVYAEKDARDVAAALLKAGYETSLWASQDGSKTEPQSVRDVVGALLDLTREADDNDLLLLYFSGHGFLHEGESFLCLRGTTGPENALSVQDLQATLEDRIACRQGLLIIDACRTSASTRGAPLNASFDLSQVKGVATLFSSQAGMPSWEPSELDRKEGIENGVFTHFLLEAFRGRGDTSEDGRLTYQETAAYIHGKLEAHSRLRGRDVQGERSWSGDLLGDLLLMEVQAAEPATKPARGQRVHLAFDPPLPAADEEKAEAAVRSALSELAGIEFVEQPEGSTLQLSLHAPDGEQLEKPKVAVCSGWPTWSIRSTREGNSSEVLSRGVFLEKGVVPARNGRSLTEVRSRVLAEGLRRLEESKALENTVARALRAHRSPPGDG